MISRQTITHPFNRGDYTVGAPSQAKWARHTPVGDGPAALQGETVTVPDRVLAELREAAAAVHVERDRGGRPDPGLVGGFDDRGDRGPPGHPGRGGRGGGRRRTRSRPCCGSATRPECR